MGESVGSSSLVDGSVCDCCPTAAFVGSGGARVLYRDRTVQEVRDISVSGIERSRPNPVAEDGWRIEGCPVNGPAADAAGDRVFAAWFTAASGPEVRVAASEDGGLSFVDSWTIDDRKPVGRPDVVAVGEGAIVVWLGVRDGSAALLARYAGIDGPISDEVLLAPMSGSRMSGFPQAERLGNELVVVWRDVEAGPGVGTGRLRLLRVPLESVCR